MNIEIGQKAFATKKFDERCVNLFAELTGDYNLIHFNKEYAENTIFKTGVDICSSQKGSVKPVCSTLILNECITGGINK